MKNCNPWVLTYLGLLFSGMQVQATQLSPEQALGRWQGTDTAKRIISSGGPMRLAHTSLCEKTDTPAFYVFDKPSGGYVILSADDRLCTVLADVDQGRFDISSIPDNMRWWLGEYNREISWYLSTAGKEATGEASVSPEKIIMQDKRENVEPLLYTQWDQSSPFNDLCPDFNGTKAVTGCVATAMAQIMKYHEWPATHGFGSNTYTYRGQTYSFDFQNTVFDWANMRNSYQNTIYTPEQVKAVATLMLACGVGVNMEYSDDQSGAVSFRIAPAFRDFFGYAESTSSVIRDTYSLWEWEELIYQEVASGRPVCYSGVGGLGGHQFVADGYRNDNLFHINWGWSGVSNGYFRLTSLNPSIHGIGGGGGSFDYMQEAVVRCCPPEQGEGLKPLTPTYIKGNFAITSINSADDEGAILGIGFVNGGMYANVVHDYPGKFGVLLTDEYENEIGWYPHMDINFPGGTQYGLYGYHEASSYVPRPEKSGIYRVYPAFLPDEGEWTRVPVYNGGNRYLNLVVEDDRKMTFDNNGLKELPELEIVNLVIPSDIVAGESMSVLADALNGNVPYSGKLYLWESEGEDNEDTPATKPLGSVFLDIPANMYNLYEMPVTFNLDPGDYKVYFADCLNRRISSDFPITVLENSNVHVATIESEDNTIGEWYDLQGRRLSTSPSEAGIYIRVRDGHRQKVVVTR